MPIRIKFNLSTQTHSTPSRSSSSAQTPSTAAPPNNSHTTTSGGGKHGPDNHSGTDTFDRGDGKSYTSWERTRWRSLVVLKSLDEDTRGPC
jgi:hypothetical protein